MIDTRFQSRFSPQAEINVVPYIDVMLVLLIIFMVTAPLLHQGVNVDLPQASAQALPPQTDLPMIVSVSQSGELFLNVSELPEDAMLPEVMAYRLAAELKRSPNRKVFVRADKNAAYGTVMSAMVLLQRSGVPNVGLITTENSSEG